MAESVKAGKILDLPSGDTLSDGTAGGIEENAVRTNNIIVMPQNNDRRSQIFYFTSFR